MIPGDMDAEERQGQEQNRRDKEEGPGWDSIHGN